MTSFMYSNACFCIVSNDLTVCFIVGVTWWRTLLLGEGMGYGPQGQGDVRCRLQPGGPPPLGVQQSLHPKPSHRVHNGGQGGPWGGVTYACNALVVDTLNSNLMLVLWYDICVPLWIIVTYVMWCVEMIYICDICAVKHICAVIYIYVL